jgi:integrase
MASYFIKRPGKGRRSWSIIQPDGKTSQDPRIPSINRLFQDGGLDREQAEQQIQKVLHDLQEKDRPEKVKWRDDNELLVNKFFRDVYEERELVGKVTAESKFAARCTLNRVLSMLGQLDVTSASLSDLQRALLRAPEKSRKHLALGLNQILRYINRRERVSVPKGRKVRCRFLSVPEFEKMLKLVPREFQLPIVVSFATGCRVGEVFALRRRVGKGSVWVESQITPKFITKATKNRRERETTVIPPYLPKVEEWLAIPMETRNLLRRKKWHSIVRQACIEAFPGDLEKACTFHDLRHSYAVYWFGLLGARALKVVANCLGDSAEVTELYYGWRVQTSSDEELMLAAASKKE